MMFEKNIFYAALEIDMCVWKYLVRDILGRMKRAEGKEFEEHNSARICLQEEAILEQARERN